MDIGKESAVLEMDIPLFVRFDFVYKISKECVSLFMIYRPFIYSQIAKHKLRCVYF